MCSQSLPQFKVGKRLSVLRLNDVVIIIYRLLNKYKIQRVKRKGKKENKSKKKWKKSCKNRVCNLEKISVATLLLLRPKVANQPWPCYLCTVQRDNHRASKQHFAHHRAAPLNKSLYLQRETRTFLWKELCVFFLFSLHSFWEMPDHFTFCHTGSPTRTAESACAQKSRFIFIRIKKKKSAPSRKSWRGRGFERWSVKDNLSPVAKAKTRSSLINLSSLNLQAILPRSFPNIHVRCVLC